MADKDNDLDDILGDKEGLSTPATSGNETQRRVYALPIELVERIVEFQKSKGFASEVEAVRRLLDDALKSRDDLERMVNRFLGRLKHLRIASEVAKDVLVGHPLVTSMSFGNESVQFQLKDGWSATISDEGYVSILDRHENQKRWYANEKDRFGAGSLSDPDEIPF